MVIFVQYKLFGIADPNKDTIFYWYIDFHVSIYGCVIVTSTDEYNNVFVCVTFNRIILYQ